MRLQERTISVERRNLFGVAVHNNGITLDLNAGDHMCSGIGCVQEHRQ